MEVLYQLSYPGGRDHSSGRRPARRGARVPGVDLRAGNPIIVPVLVVSGIATIVVAGVLGIVVDPLLAFIALIGVADLVVARGFATGRLGTPPAAAAAETEMRDELAPGDASRDPSYNPYARED
jgi:hypothetical protein